MFETCKLCTKKKKLKNKCVLLSIILAIMPIINCLACPSSGSCVNSINRVQNYLSGISDLRTYNLLSGTVTDCIYYLEASFSSPNKIILRKENSDNSLAWITSFAGIPSVKGFELDSNELNIYIGCHGFILSILNINTENGSLIFAKNFNSINANSYDIKVFVLNNNNGLAFISYKIGDGNTNLCRYLFSDSAFCQCYRLPFINGHASNQLKITDSQYFAIGIDSSQNLHLIDFNIDNTSITWHDEISCTATCSLMAGDSFIDSNTDKIYNFFTYGSSTYLQFATLNLTNGYVINSRYISNIACSEIWSKISMANNILALGIDCSGFHLMLYYIETSNFIFRKFNGIFVFSTIKEKYSNRFIIVGQK